MSNYTKIPDFDDYKSNQEQLSMNTEAALSLEALQKKILNTKSNLFEKIKTVKTFDEISNEIALSTPFGKKSHLYKPTVEDYDSLFTGFYVGEINYELLAEDLKKKLGSIDGFLFDATKYFSKDTFVNLSSKGKMPVMKYIKQKKPFFYTKDNEQKQAVFDKAKLNTRRNLLSNNYSYYISYDDYKVVYNLNFIYKDGEGKKEYNNDTANPSDFTLNEEYYAIQLYTEDVETFIEFIRIIKRDDYAERMKSNIVRYYNMFFEEAQDDPNTLDGLYENIPDFVLETLTDEKLWNDFMLLSQKGINTIGTNENVSVINLIKGIKNAFWWCNKINENPEIVRTVLSKLNSEYLEKFTILIANKIGIPTWKNTDYENAISYSLEIKDSDNEFSKYRIVYWCGFLEKEKKFEVGYSIHSYSDKMSISPSNTKSNTLGIINAFTPLKIIEKENLFLPTIVANFLTEEQLSEDKFIVLSNIAAGVLPELNANIFKSFSALSSRVKFSKYVEVLSKNPAFQKIYIELSGTRYMAKYISLEEEVILRFYTTNSGYRNFNQALRGEIALTEEFKIQKELMNKALNKLPKYKTEDFLYRIENLTNKQIDEYYKVGKTIENKHFTSSSYSEEAIIEAMRNREYTVLIKIKGKNGRLIEELSTLKIEREILFKSNTKFQVKEVGYDYNPLEPWKPIKRIILIEK